MRKVDNRERTGSFVYLRMPLSSTSGSEVCYSKCIPFCTLSSTFSNFPV